MTHDEKIQRQIELEQKSRGDGQARYWRNYDKSVKKGQFSATAPGTDLMHTIVGRLAERIEAWQKDRSRAASRNMSLKLMLDNFKPEMVAFVTAKLILNTVTKRESVQSTAIAIARFLEDDLNYRIFRKAMPKYVEKVKKHQEMKRTNYRTKTFVMRKMQKQKGVDEVEWSIEEKARLGMYLVEMFCEVSGWVERVTVWTAERREKTLLQPTPELLAWVNDANTAKELLTPVYHPMIVSPVDWTNPFDGGYYDLPLTLVKNKDRDKIGRAYLQELAGKDMPRVYEAVNTLQRTPWRVNRNVFEVVKRLFFSDEFKGNLAGLPPRDRFEKPTAGPEFYTDMEYKKAHKRELAKIEELNNQLDSKRIATAAQIETAEMLLNEPEFFFPYQLDFRGRVYPVPARLNPQGEDSARGMLEFANGLPIGRDGGKWLAIHGANMYGVDKVSFEDRVKWVLENDRVIAECAMYPFDSLGFWTKADKPFQFLAFCFEWTAYTTHLAEGKFMDSFISRLPIAMDGSNNGIQNLSALGRDVNAATFVNLIPSDVPQDIYQLVADRVIEAVKADYNNPDPKRRAQAYGWEGHITRKIVKRPIMTMPYGVTQYGMIDQIQQELVSMQLQGKCPFNTDCRAEAAYLAVKLREVLGDTVASAVGVMTWLQEVAQVVARDGLPIVWQTPIGFHVQQNYRKLDSKRVITLLGGVRVESRINVPTSAVDVKSMSRGISPNLVHSFDASHMMDTILRCKERGVMDFQMIHDSYGTHACNAGLLAHELREAFITQYTPDRLREFVEQLREQVGEDSRPNLIDPPEYGELDINVVRDSLYFFA